MNDDVEVNACVVKKDDFKLFEIHVEYGHYEHYLYFALDVDFAAKQVRVRTATEGQQRVLLLSPTRSNCSSQFCATQ